MKKISKFLTCLLLLVVFISGCQKQEAEKEEPKPDLSTPLFYKISDDNTDATIYLLGSIHAADDTAYPFSDSIMSAFNNSEYLAVEVDTVELTSNFDAQIKLAQKLMYSDGTTIKDALGEELYQDMVELLKSKNLYSSLYDSYKPAFFESLFENAFIEEAGMDANKGIDMYFLNTAKENNKKILEVETADFQYNLLLSNPLELDIMMLEDYVYNYDDGVSDIKELYNAWKSGDITLLEEMLYEDYDDDLTEEEIMLIDNYNQSLITDRNYGMVKALEGYFKEEKNVFCVVGLGHVIGEEGIISLMEKKGYKIEKIS